MFESPPEVMLPNDAFKALGFEGANPDCQRWLGKTEWVDLCPPYTHPHLFKQGIPFLCFTYRGKCLHVPYNKLLSSVSQYTSNTLWEERVLQIVCP